MNAKEYYESKEWGNPHWDRKTATQFDKSEMLDFAEHYHQSKLKLLGIGDVVGQSEQLVAFGIWLDKNEKHLENGNITKTVQEYLKGN